MIEETTNIVAETINNNAEETMTQQVESYTQLINTYGASAVIVAVFIVVLIAMLFYILKANNVTHKQMIAQQQELVNMMMEMVKRGENIEKESKKPTIIKEPNLVELFLNINGTIKDTLKDISEDLETDRTSVYVFHNGIFSSHGLPFFKISCVCEVVKKGSGVIKHLKDHSGMPLQLFDNTVSNIYKNGRMTVYDVDNEEDEFVQTSPVLCGMLKNNSVKSATGIAIYDHDNNIMGILIVEYSDKKDPILLDEATNTLVTKAPLLSPVLEYSGIYDATNK